MSCAHLGFSVPEVGSTTQPGLALDRRGVTSCPPFWSIALAALFLGPSQPQT